MANPSSGKRSFPIFARSLFTHVLSTAIIDQMIRGSASSPSATVLYCYFDFQDTHKQDVAGLLRSLLRQLYAASPQVTKIFEERYEACKRGKEILTHGALTKMLQKAIPKFKNVFIVVDALDECTELDELLELLEIIHQWKLAPLHLVTTSRTYYNIEESLLSLVSHTVLVEDSSIRDDIGVYVDNKLNHARPFSQLGSELRESIRKTLISGAHGMFRWVECQFDNLRRCRTPNEYHSALSSLPKTLNETYERMLDAVKAEDRERALKVLSLLVCSLRPLRIIDIAEATALNPDGPPYLDLGNRLLNPLDVLSLCPGLLATATKEPGSDDQLASDTSINVGVYHYLRLAHFSVKEYLLSTRMTLHSSQLPWYAMDHLGTNDLVARLCIAYLQFQEEVYRDRTSYRGYISVNHYVHVPRGYPLYNYARHNWFRHTQSCDTDANFRCHALAGQLISDCVRWGLWKYEHLFHGDCHFDTGEAFGLDHELYHASQYGLFQASALLIATGAEPSTAWGPEGSALHVVCTRHDAPASRIQIIRLLLQQGADVNAHTYDATALRSAKMWPFSVFSPQKRYGALRKIAKLKFKSPLTIAMQERHLGYTDVLLRHGAETEARNMRMETALLHATRNQDVRCVRLLLDNKADIEARNESGGTSLFVAAEDGLDEIVKLLLTYGARVNTQDASSRTPLSVALDVWPYQPEITEALLRKGADCNLGEPVSMIRPILHDCRTTVELMIAGGGDIHRYDEGYGTPLHAAARSGKQTIVNILLRKGASVSPKCHHVLTVLEAAASNGNRLIMEKILNHGADVNEISASGQSALQIASSYGHKHAVKLLLDRGANPYITDNQLGTLFKRAMEHEDIVRLLLDHLANDKEPGVSGSAAGGARL